MPKTIAQISHTDIGDYFETHLPDAIGSDDPGRIEYSRHPARLWITPDDIHTLILAVDYGTHIDVITFDGLTEFFENTTYTSRPPDFHANPLAAVGRHYGRTST